MTNYTIRAGKNLINRYPSLAIPARKLRHLHFRSRFWLEDTKYYLKQLGNRAPHRPKLPPTRLRIRISDGKSQKYFQIGATVHTQLKLHIEKYRSLEEFERVLDWGCGCGRVTQRMLASVSADRLYGCDIDPSAIKWMQKTMKGSSFVKIDPYPPTPYKDGFFDLIYGISVFTHLDEETQFKWLAELHRIVSKDGIVAVSTHADRGATCPDLQKALHADGIADMPGPKAHFFRRYLEDEYYRLTKHQKDYVLREWSRYFEILEFIENGIGRQDLVVMRRIN